MLLTQAVHQKTELSGEPSSFGFSGNLKDVASSVALLWVSAPVPNPLT